LLQITARILSVRKNASQTRSGSFYSEFSRHIQKCAAGEKRLGPDAGKKQITTTTGGMSNIRQGVYYLCHTYVLLPNASGGPKSTFHTLAHTQAVALDDFSAFSAVSRSALRSFMPKSHKILGI